MMDGLIDVEIIKPIEEANKYLLQFKNDLISLTQLIEEMNSIYSDPTFGQKTSNYVPEIGKNYAIKVNDNWYRAQVKANVLTSQHTIKCYLIDVGKYEMVPIYNLRDLSFHLEHQNPLVKVCNLFGIYPITMLTDNYGKVFMGQSKKFDSAALKYIYNITKGCEQWKARIKNEIYGITYIELYYLDDNLKSYVCINDFLVKNDFARYVENESHSSSPSIQTAAGLEADSTDKSYVLEEPIENVSTDEISSVNDTNSAAIDDNKVTEDENMETERRVGIGRGKMAKHFLLLNMDKAGPNNNDLSLKNVKTDCIVENQFSDDLRMIDEAGIWLEGVSSLKYSKNIRDQPFFDTISKNFPGTLRDISFLQPYLWQLVDNLKNLICVAPSFLISPTFGGKTLGYILPIFNKLITENKYSHHLPKYGTSPFIIIICPYSTSVEKVGLQISFLAKAFNLKCLYIYASLDQLEKEVMLINGCDILVTTIESLYSLIERKITSLKRLCYLIFEEFSTMLEFSEDQIRKLVADYEFTLRDRTCRQQVPEQIMIFSSKWVPKLKDYQARFNSILIISSKKECLYASQVTQVPIICSSNKKIWHLTDILNNNDKVLLCTNDHESSLIVAEVLKSIHVTYLLITKDINKNYSEYHHDKVKCIVIGDNEQDFARISDGQCLLHWNLPNNADSFFKRLWLMRDNFQIKTNQNVPKIESNILIDEEVHNNLMCVSILKVLSRLKVPMPPYLEQLVEQELLIKTKEYSIDLCDKLKSFGFCRIDKCPLRHKIFEAHDFSLNNRFIDLPESGTIKIKILRVQSPTIYFAELLSHQKISNDDKITEITTRKKLIIDINFFYKSVDGQLFLNNVVVPQLNQIYALKNKQTDIYERIQVKEIKEKQEQAIVYFVDNGSYKSVWLHNIVPLPEHFIEVAHQAVEICICRLQPPENDTAWTNKANCFVSNLLEKKILVGKILFKLGNTLWLDPLEEYEKLKNLKMWNKKMNVRQHLIDHKIALENPSHLDNLKQTLLSFEQVVKINELPCTSKGQHIKTCTEKFPEENIQNKFHEIYISSSKSSNLLFVQLVKNNKRLEKIADDIQKYILYNKVEPLKNLKNNSLVLARNTDNIWYRCLILSSLKQAKVYFLDYGDVNEIDPIDIIPLPSKLLHPPFQAIRCCLDGIDVCKDDDRFSQLVLDATGLPGGGDPCVVYAKIINQVLMESLDTYQYTIEVFIRNSFGYYENLSHILLQNNVATISSNKIMNILEYIDVKIYSEEFKSQIRDVLIDIQEDKLALHSIQELSTSIEKYASCHNLLTFTCEIMGLLKCSSFKLILLQVIVVTKTNIDHCNELKNSSIWDTIMILLHQDQIANICFKDVLFNLEFMLRCCRCANSFIARNGLLFMTSFLNLILSPNQESSHNLIIFQVLSIINNLMKVNEIKSKPFNTTMLELILKCIPLADKQIACELLKTISFWINIDPTFLSKFCTLGGINQIYNQSCFWNNHKMLNNTLELFETFSLNKITSKYFKITDKEKVMIRCTNLGIILDERYSLLIDRIFHNIEKHEKKHIDETLNFSPIKDDELQIANCRKKPQLTWYEADAEVVVSVHVQDVTQRNCFVNFQKSHLSFRSIANKTEYSFQFDLYGEIVAEKSQTQIKNSEIILRLVKVDQKDWKRLTKLKNEYSFLQPNFNVIQCDEEEQLSNFPFKYDDSDDSEDSNHSDEEQFYYD